MQYTLDVTGGVRLIARIGAAVVPTRARQEGREDWDAAGSGLPCTPRSRAVSTRSSSTICLRQRRASGSYDEVWIPGSSGSTR